MDILNLELATARILEVLIGRFCYQASCFPLLLVFLYAKLS